MKDQYADFTGSYDLPYGASEQVAPCMDKFYRRLFDEHQVEHVLDCAYGTRRHLLMLHKLGFRVYGSDLSPAMLVQARMNLVTAGVEITLQQANLRYLEE